MTPSRYTDPITTHNYSKFWGSEVDSGTKELESSYFSIPELPGAHHWLRDYDTYAPSRARQAERRFCNGVQVDQNSHVGSFACKVLNARGQGPGPHKRVWPRSTACI